MVLLQLDDRGDATILENLVGLVPILRSKSRRGGRSRLVAGGLLLLANLNSRLQDEPVELCFRQGDLAKYLGITREQANLALTGLRKAGVVSYRGMLGKRGPASTYSFLPAELEKFLGEPRLETTANPA